MTKRTAEQMARALDLASQTKSALAQALAIELEGETDLDAADRLKSAEALVRAALEILDDKDSEAARLVLSIRFGKLGGIGDVLDSEPKANDWNLPQDLVDWATDSDECANLGEELLRQHGIDEFSTRDCVRGALSFFAEFGFDTIAKAKAELGIEESGL